MINKRKTKDILKMILPYGLKSRLNLIRASYLENKFKDIKRISIDKSFDKTYNMNLIGYQRDGTGIGQSINSLNNCLELLNPDATALKDLDTLWHNRNYFKDNQASFKGINIYHVNADETYIFLNRFGQEVFNNGYNIAYWWWELSEFPDRWVTIAALYDEIWVGSEFIKTAIEEKIKVPVYLVPPSINIENNMKYQREDFNIPDSKFVFLTMYDVKSIVERKNPESAIDAYLRAFPSEDEAILVVKISNAKDRSGAIDALYQRLKKRKDILIIDEYLHRDKLLSLIRCVDAFVSMHRSEGFGLVIAEAMAMGKAVISTGWSGNMDFMDENNACIVDYELIKTNQKYGPYDKNKIWADPSIEHACYFMRKLINDMTYYQTLSGNAKKTIKEKYDTSVVTNIVRMHLERIYKKA